MRIRPHAFLCFPCLKQKLQRELHDARVAGGTNHPKSAWGVQIRARSEQVRMIEHVESLRTEHQMEPFGTQGECLHNGWIDVDPTRGAEAISLDIAVGSGRICLEGSRVEFSVHIDGRALDSSRLGRARVPFVSCWQSQ
jgi:hypothetical protein